MTTKSDFIKSKLAGLKKIIYGDELGLETPGEHEKLEKFCEKFIDDLKALAKNNGK